MRRLAAATAVAVLVLAAPSCGRRDLPAIDQAGEAAAARRVYADLLAPLTAGQERLAATLPAAFEKPVIFRVDRHGAKRLDTPLSADLLWDEQCVVFLRVDAQPPVAGTTDQRTVGPADLPTAAIPAWHYFNPRDLRIIPCATCPGADSDLWCRPDGSLSVVRAVPISGKGGRRENGLDLVRFDFRHDAAGELHAGDCMRLTDEPGDCSLPVPLPGGQHIAFLRAASPAPGAPRSVAIVPAAGGALRALPIVGATDARLLRRLDDGRLLVAANAGGWWRLHAANPADGVWTAYAGPEPAAPVSGLVLGARSADGAHAPAVYRLPATLDLPTTLALVAAHNPAVNRRRALLAAALIEARRLHLAKRPTLNFGLTYTPFAGGGVAGVDYLAAGLARGLIGVVQSLTDFERLSFLGEAGRARAEIARDAIALELNRTSGEAAETWFEARRLDGERRIADELVRHAGDALAQVQTLHRAGEALAADALAARLELTAAEAGSALARRRLDYAKDRLRALCDLPPGCALTLSDDSYRFELADEHPIAELRRLALLNHPRLSAAQKALGAAFAEYRGDGRNRATAFLEVNAGQVARDFTDPLDNYITTALDVSMPLAALDDRGLRREQWAQVRRSYELDVVEQSQAVVALVEEAQVDVAKARDALRVQRLTVAEGLERLRVARLRAAAADAGGPAAPPAVGAAPALIAAHQAFYRALTSVNAARSELALRHCRLWRELGLAARLADEAAPVRSDRVAQAGTALWLWESKPIIADAAAIEEWLLVAERERVRRVYVYLYSDARLTAAAEPEAVAPGPAAPGVAAPVVVLPAASESAEQLARFIDHCAAAGIEVWGLLGEPEWLDDINDAPAARACARISAFNSRIAPLLPRLAGLKLDLEPHSRPGWRRDAAARERLGARFLHLVGLFRRELPAGLPLWADCPVQFFRGESTSLSSQLAGLVDGVTLMAYGETADWIVQRSHEALAVWPKAMEIGIEVSPDAPAGETLAKRSLDEIATLRRALVEAGRRHPHFAGVAVHGLRMKAGP